MAPLDPLATLVIKTWEVYRTHKHHKQFGFMYTWQANNTNNSTYELTFTHLEWLESHNTKHITTKVERLLNYCSAWHLSQQLGHWTHCSTYFRTRVVVQTKKMWERTKKTSHFETASNLKQNMQRYGNAVPTRSCTTTPLAPFQLGSSKRQCLCLNKLRTQTSSVASIPPVGRATVLGTTGVDGSVCMGSCDGIASRRKQ